MDSRDSHVTRLWGRLEIGQFTAPLMYYTRAKWRWGGVGQKAPKRNTKRSVQPSEKAFLVTGCTRGTAKAGRAQPETKTLAASRFVRVSFTPFSRYNPSSTRAIRARRGVSGFFPGLGVQETSPSTNRHGKQLCYRPV